MKYFIEFTEMDYVDKNKLVTSIKEGVKFWQNSFCRDKWRLGLLRDEVKRIVEKCHQEHPRCKKLVLEEKTIDSEHEMRISGVFHMRVLEIKTDI